MKRVAELIHIIPSERDKYLKKYINPSDKIAQILWECGIRKQFYYELGEEILRTYEYTGKAFNKDMDIIVNFPETKDFFVKDRRKDLSEEERKTRNWWAPLKWFGSSLMTDPVPEEDELTASIRAGYECAMDGNMSDEEPRNYNYSEDDWSESVHM